MIAVLDYGIGNLRSAEKAIEHLGGDALLVRRVEDARGATGVILPGVGHFGACATALRASGLDAVCYEAVASHVPFFGICVGFQLLFDGSEEAPEIPGLGIVPGTVQRLSSDEKLPQMQWNALVRTGQDSAMLAGVEAPWCYFVHSYAPVPDDDEAAGVVATCDYGGRVVAAIERGLCWGTQFHPEKSGRVGLSVLSAFIGLVEAHAAASGAVIGGAPVASSS